ncbi:hypothetical protein BSR29_08030 [Boudabousia liubingyangii]|uniref:DNA-binding transcriptional regulator n=1 Tax=Boudabousia liubingyangii TaxID=1921764 RepID=A0A1Q5PJV5_9ACTO|nr:YerC/YecD family TrpR-related protein [Boudabousia liubingyangii]OKL46189.1 hypothetical protein BSR29_08030 [Boudabousia liubingyangii]
MKRPQSRELPGFSELVEVLAKMTSELEVKAFLEDLCTPAELEAMSDRWRVVQPLQEGLSYRVIAAETGVSVTTVGRVARHLSTGAGGYQAALKLIEQG